MGTSKVVSSKPKVVDLTTSNFQPTTGAKKLVIKNLRTKSRQDLGEYYQRTWDDLDDTLTSIFSGCTPRSPLEVLCRGVEATCRRGDAEKLAKHLRDRCKAYLEKTLLPKIESEAGSSNVEALSTVHKYWTVWNRQAVSLPIPPQYILLTVTVADPYSIHLQLPRSIVPTQPERAATVRGYGHTAIPTCDLLKK